MVDNRPVLRRNARRHKKSYREPVTDSEDDSVTSLPTRSLPARASRYLQRAHYNDGLSSPSSTSSEDDQPVQRPRPTRLSVTVKRKTRSTTSISNVAFRAFKRQKVYHHTPNTVLNSKIQSLRTHIPVTGKIPLWQSLPHHVLVRIMFFASFPLYSGTSKDTGSARWLLNTSKLSASFHEACIDALMYSPPMFPTHRAHWLIELLRASARDYGNIQHSDGAVGPGEGRNRLSTDYRKKVKSLEIEVKQILVKKAGIHLEELLKHTPLLKHLRLYHNHDSLSDRYVWAQPSHARSKGRWSYGNLFQLLDQYGILLDSFEWNGRFLVEDDLLINFHSTSEASRSLSRLRYLALRNFSSSDTETLSEVVCNATDLIADFQYTGVNARAAKVMAWRSHILRALSVSRELREVVINDSNIFDDSTVAQLPAGLERLEIKNCVYVKSDGICEYLRKNGQSLTALVLKGNQSMSLDFLKDLKLNAPQLSTLEIDLTFHDPTSFRDTEPLFDELIPSGSPSWPSALEAISIGPLRNLGAEDAEAFYQSLVDAAPHLPYLRIVQLRTILNKVGWRDRASLRHKWDAKFNEIFHVRFNADANTPSESSNDSQGRKSRRLKDLEDVESHGYGRCHTVVFDLSDQRPAQDQFTEGDFLDDPDDAEDAEWNGTDNIEPPKYSSRRYAW